MCDAPGFLWNLMGCPPVVGVVDVPSGSVCAVSGEPITRGVKAKDACGASFRWELAARRDSGWVCEAVAWSIAGKPPATLRMWTVAATDAALAPSHPKCAVPTPPQVHATNRADMRQVAAMLTDPPTGRWLVSVAVSGQKHVLPHAHTNTGGGGWTIRMEQQDVTCAPDRFAGLLGRVVALRTAGFGPDRIADLNPGGLLSTRERLTAWMTHTAPLMPLRGSALLALAASLPTKEHMDEYTDRYPVV